MKGIILAAGKGVRMKPYTDKIPKALLELKGKTLLHWNLERLKEAGATEIGIVIGDKKEQIIEKIGNEFKTIKISYIVQQEQKGNANALLKAESYLGGENFWMLSCDVVPNILVLTQLKSILERNNYSATMLGEEVSDNLERFGVIDVRNGVVTRITEKPDEKIDKGIVNRSTYFFTPVIFEAIKKIKPNVRSNEYWLTDALQLLIDNNHKIGIVVGKNIVDIAYPEDLKKAEKLI